MPLGLAKNARGGICPAGRERTFGGNPPFVTLVTKGRGVPKVPPYSLQHTYRLKKGFMYREWTDNASTLDRLSPEKDRFAQSRKSKVESRKSKERPPRRTQRRVIYWSKITQN